jgi:tumor protein p53-inducible protein 3
VIADPVGASNAARNVASLAIDGIWVLYGSMGGRIVDNFDLGALVAKRGALMTTTLKTRSNDYKKELLE